jgi:hypothetical protein
MAKFKVQKTSVSGITVDSYTGPSQLGGVGGNTAQAVPTIQVDFRMGGTEYTGWIMAQKGIRKFRVSDGAGHVTDCYLTDLAAGALTADGQMTILVTTTTGTFNASRITNKYVYDFAGNRYRYWMSAPTATFVQVANA